MMCLGSFVRAPDGGGRCLFCNKTFKSLAFTRRHVKIVHTVQDPYDCTICGRTLPNSYALRTHINLKHGIKGEKDVANKYGRRHKDMTKNEQFEYVHLEDKSLD